MTCRSAEDAGDDAGNVTITAAFGSAALVAAVMAVLMASGELIAARQAVVAADLTALAAAQALIRGSEPCAVAKAVAADNDAEVRDCIVDGEDVEVAVEVGRRRGVARAGP